MRSKSTLLKMTGIFFSESISFTCSLHICALINNILSLRELAVEGYCSFIRSYAAYPSELKPIFHIKKLHLGHIAKSFGIRDKPTDFLTGRDDLRWAQKREDAGAVIDQATKDKAKERKEKRKKIVETKMKDLILSEFAC